MNGSEEVRNRKKTKSNSINAATMFGHEKQVVGTSLGKKKSLVLSNAKSLLNVTDDRHLKIDTSDSTTSAASDSSSSNNNNNNNGEETIKVIDLIDDVAMATKSTTATISSSSSTHSSSRSSKSCTSFASSSSNNNFICLKYFAPTVHHNANSQQTTELRSELIQVKPGQKLRDLIKPLLSSQALDIDHYDLYHNGLYESLKESRASDDQMASTPSVSLDLNTPCDAYKGHEFYLKRNIF